MSNVTSRRPWAGACVGASGSQSTPSVRVVRENQRVEATEEGGGRILQEKNDSAAVSSLPVGAKVSSSCRSAAGGSCRETSKPSTPRLGKLGTRSASKTAALARESHVAAGARPSRGPGAPRPSKGLLPPPKQGLPSARLKQQSKSPFAKPGSSSSPFGTAYAAGNIPCHIHHGSVKQSLTWTTAPELLPTFDPLLVLCAEGLRETLYPLHFVACQAFSELVLSPGAAEKVQPLLERVVPGIRRALLQGGGEDGAVTRGALRAVRDLAAAVGPALTPHANPVLIQVGKKMFERRLKADVSDTLQALEAAGGSGMLALIRAKVPSYTPLGHN